MLVRLRDLLLDDMKIEVINHYHLENISYYDMFFCRNLYNIMYIHINYNIIFFYW